MGQKCIFLVESDLRHKEVANVYILGDFLTQFLNIRNDLICGTLTIIVVNNLVDHFSFLNQQKSIKKCEYIITWSVNGKDYAFVLLLC